MERKYAIRSDHLKDQSEVFPRMRTVLLDWINEVHLQYRFVQETFHITALIIDRYLQVCAIKLILTSKQQQELRFEI